MFQALSVLILYVRCTAIDPADPGILINCDGGPAYKSSKVHISNWLFLILFKTISLQPVFACCLKNRGRGFSGRSQQDRIEDRRKD